MIITAQGKISYETIDELYYEFFLAIGLGVTIDQYLYDQDTGNAIAFREKRVKASVDGRPVYAGMNDIVFEPDKNYSLVSNLFGYYLDKIQNSDDGDMLGGFVSQGIIDNETRDKQAIMVRTIGRGDICSDFYYNIYLAYMDEVFRIEGMQVDLSNFDTIPQ